ncbi:MAG: thioredoxin family protein [Blastocatellia bacterium]|nr:thioredoxin family protein [Blastocatellia bacterium]
MNGRGGETPPQFATGSFRRAGSGRFDASKPLSAYRDAPVKITDETEIAWLKDLSEARKLSREAEVPLLIEFYFDSCSICAAMAKGPLRDPSVIALSRKYVTVKVDLDTQAGTALAEELELLGSPVFVIYNPGGQVLIKQSGYTETDILTSLLREGLDRSETSPQSK